MPGQHALLCHRRRSSSRLALPALPDFRRADEDIVRVEARPAEAPRAVEEPSLQRGTWTGSGPAAAGRGRRAPIRRPLARPLLGGERGVAVGAREEVGDVAVAPVHEGTAQPADASPSTLPTRARRAPRSARGPGGRGGAASRDRGRRGGSTAPTRCCAAGRDSRRAGRRRPARAGSRRAAPEMTCSSASSERIQSPRACAEREVLLRGEAGPGPHDDAIRELARDLHGLVRATGRRRRRSRPPRPRCPGTRAGAPPRSSVITTTGPPTRHAALRAADRVIRGDPDDGVEDGIDAERRPSCRPGSGARDARPVRPVARGDGRAVESDAGHAERGGHVQRPRVTGHDDARRRSRARSSPRSVGGASTAPRDARRRWPARHRASSRAPEDEHAGAALVGEPPRQFARSSRGASACRPGRPPD